MWIRECPTLRIVGRADALDRYAAQAVHAPTRDDLLDEDADEQDGQIRVSFHVFPLADDGGRRGGDGA